MLNDNNLDISNLLLDFFKSKKIKGYYELLDDYNKLLDMKNKRQIDINQLFIIWNKYQKEINEIDKYRIIACKINHIKTNSRVITNDFYSVDILLNYIVSIMCLRYSKSIYDENIKSRLLSSNEKVMYEILTSIRDMK